jgi:putative ABC transport system permease protein
MTWNLSVSARALADEAAAALAANRIRTCLAAIGIVFGVATVVTALAIAEGAEVAAVEEIGALGVDNVFLRAATSFPVLTLGDVRAMRSALGPHAIVSPVRAVGAEIRTDERRALGHLAGVTVSWSSLTGAELAWGRWMAPIDERTRLRVAIIGAELSRELFGGEVPAGARVFAGGNWYAVIGGLRQRSNAGTGRNVQSIDVDRALIVPLTVMDVSAGKGDAIDRVHEIGVRVGGPGEVETTGQLLAAIASRRHGGLSQFELIVPRELLRARLRAQRTFHVVLIAIGALALLISGIGIMNIMLASVIERTNEIGVRLAIGARRSDIVKQFGIESAALCLAGGVAGVPLGALFSLIVARAGGWPVSVSAGSILLALLMATLVGVVFGVYPARVAAAVEPIDALRAP